MLICLWYTGKLCNKVQSPHNLPFSGFLLQSPDSLVCYCMLFIEYSKNFPPSFFLIPPRINRYVVWLCVPDDNEFSANSDPNTLVPFRS